MITCISTLQQVVLACICKDFIAKKEDSNKESLQKLACLMYNKFFNQQFTYQNVPDGIDIDFYDWFYYLTMFYLFVIHS